jgi:type II secretory pathway component PulF
MNRSAATLHFSELLLTLLRGKTTLLDALHIRARKGIKKQVRESAISLLNLMKKGKGFSESLQNLNQGKVFFDSLYLTLIASAEATGNIEKVLERIVIDLNRKKKAKENLINILIYPVMIIVLAVIGTIAIIVKGLPLFIMNGMLSGAAVQDAIFGIVLAGLVLFSGAVVLFCVYYKIFYNDSPEFRIFYLLDLLLQSNITLPDTLSHCILSFGRTKLGHSLVLIKKDISSGLSFSTAFTRIKSLSPYVLGWLSLADKHGNLNEICRFIKNHYAEKNEKTREIATKLIEPMIIILTGLYLLIIMVNVILPILTFSGGLL